MGRKREFSGMERGFPSHWLRPTSTGLGSELQASHEINVFSAALRILSGVMHNARTTSGPQPGPRIKLYTRIFRPIPLPSIKANYADVAKMSRKNF